MLSAIRHSRLTGELFRSDRYIDENGMVPVPAFSVDLLSIGLQTLGFCPPGTEPAQIVDMYLDDPRCRIVSPNALFDEVWYRYVNADVMAEIIAGRYLCGFQHFIDRGIHEGRWPNAEMAAQRGTQPALPALETINAQHLLETYPAARLFLQAFPALDVLAFYNLYGRHLGYRPQRVAWRAPVHDLLETEFDAAFYRARYMQDLPDDSGGSGREFAHYVSAGRLSGASPNTWFDESFYLAYHADVADAIRSGIFLCGFHHFLMYGRAEARLTEHRLQDALEAALPGVTAPSLLHRVDDLRAKISFGTPAPRVEKPAERRRVWFIFPILNPDIAFGGYQAAFALMVELYRAGFALGAICMEDSAPNKAYFLWHQKDADARAAFGDCLFFGKGDYDNLPLARGDLMVVYSIWGLEFGRHLAGLVGVTVPYVLAQEHEPVFYANDALQVLCSEYYRLPHYPIVNSALLVAYFRAQRIGVFAGDALVWRDYAWFEHALRTLPCQSAVDMRNRTRRTMVVYARPEAHAGRNLFDLIVIALQDLCRESVFGPEWSFLGLGALSDLKPVQLGGRHRLVLKQKTSAAEYQTLMSEIDVGVSLMCAPHPSLMPFEMATSGAVVVTNSYSNRDAGHFAALSGNFVVTELGLADIRAALRRAAALSLDFEHRATNAYRPQATTWRQIFSPEFIETVFGNPAATAVAPTEAAQREVA